MIDNKNVLAIIPARGGSKGLPRKNILPLCGKPLINYTIEQSIRCQYIDRVVVSTDDSEIAEIALLAGANLPFIRPDYLSTDTATSFDVIMHCLNWHEENRFDFGYLIFLQPTSPLRTLEDINLAFKLIENLNAKAIVTVCESEHHPFGMNTLPSNNNMNEFEKPEYERQPRQQLPKYFRINGAIYLSEIKYFKSQMSFLGPQTFAMIMDKSHSIDIDDEIDLEFANFYMEKTKYKYQNNLGIK